jgi:hypothetical protein
VKRRPRKPPPKRRATGTTRPPRAKKPARRPKLAKRATRAARARVPARATLERLLTEARRRTGAEAGTVYLREKKFLRFAIVQNDLLERRVSHAEFARRLRGERLPLDRVSIATWVALTKTTVNLPAIHDYPLDRPYAVDRRIDRRLEYVTRSVLATPLRDVDGTVLGVLQLINALDRRARIVSFDRSDELAVAALVQAAFPRTPTGG